MIFILLGITLCITAAVYFLFGFAKKDIVVDKEAKKRASTGESWTVMIYVSGSTAEEKHSSAGEMLCSLPYNLPENINVIVETGGSRKWSIEGIKRDKLQDFEVQKNGIREIEEMPLKNMGTAEVYGDFLKRTMQKYPADRYVSVVWGDGGGALRGAVSDAAFGYDTLTIDEMTYALSGLDEKLDIIGFDASLMSGVETVQAMALYADYMVASEDIMPRSGWDYRGFFEYISENPSASSYDAAKVVCDGVMEKATKEEKVQTVMAVTELNSASTLARDFDVLARHMEECAANKELLPKLRAEIEHSVYMGANSEWEGYSNTVDLISLSKSVFNVTKSDLARIDNTVSNIVVYKTMSKERSDVSGLNVFYPIEWNVGDVAEYKKKCPSDSYKQYMDLISDEGAEDTDIRAFYNEQVQLNKLSAAANFEGDFILSSTAPEIISRAGVELYKYNSEAGRYMRLLTDYDTKLNTATGNYEYEIANKQLELNGVAVSYEVVSIGEAYELYQIPIIYDDEISSIRVMKRRENDKAEYTSLGIWQGVNNNTGFCGRRLKAPETGDSITPIYSVYGGENGEYIKGKKMRIVFGGLNVKEKSVSSGDYLISYVAEDMYGVKTQSNTISAVAENGKLKITH